MTFFSPSSPYCKVFRQNIRHCDNHIYIQILSFLIYLLTLVFYPSTVKYSNSTAMTLLCTSAIQVSSISPTSSEIPWLFPRHSLTGLSSSVTIHVTGSGSRLLPEQRDDSLTGRLRSRNKYPTVRARTNRFKNSSNNICSVWHVCISFMCLRVHVDLIQCQK